jgi:hypothetical protein
MDFINYLMEQGLTLDEAQELAQRKHDHPKLTGVMIRGLWINLSPPTFHSIERVNEMLANGVPPKSNTDVELLSGSCNGNQFERNPAQGEFYRKECEKRGGTTKGRKYISQLARYPGDEEAWVSGRGDVQKILEKRGWGSEGAVTVKARGQTEAPPPPIPIAEHIVDRHVAEELSGRTVSRKEYLDTREKIADRITPISKRKK